MNKIDEIDLNVDESAFIEEETLLITNEVKELPYPLFSKISEQNENNCFDEKKKSEKAFFKKPSKSKPHIFNFIDFQGNVIDKNTLLLEKLKEIRRSMNKVKDALDISTIKQKKQAKLNYNEI